MVAIVTSTERQKAKCLQSNYGRPRAETMDQISGTHIIECQIRQDAYAAFCNCGGVPPADQPGAQPRATDSGGLPMRAGQLPRKRAREGDIEEELVGINKSKAEWRSDCKSHMRHLPCKRGGAFSGLLGRRGVEC
jgi:hypothetical protein